MRKMFWTPKRLEAISKTSLTLFQGFILAAVISGVLGKIERGLVKTGFVLATVLFLLLGILFSDWPLKKEG